MALPLANTFEGGTNGTVVSTGNSGGASGNAFDNISASPEYDSDVPAACAEGTMCLKIPAPANIQVAVNWWSTFGTAQGTTYGRMYVYRTSQPSEQQRIARWYDAPSGNEGGRLSWHTDGKLYWIDAAGGAGAGSTFTLPLSTLIRIEFKIVAGLAASGSAEARVFLGHSTSQISGSPYIRSGFTSAGAGGATGAISFGNTISAIPGDLWMDALQVNATDFPGPVSTLTLDSCLPDADVTTTGWSTAPLFSKVNDASDATVIQATAS